MARENGVIQVEAKESISFPFSFSFSEICHFTCRLSNYIKWIGCTIPIIEINADTLHIYVLFFALFNCLDEFPLLHFYNKQI